MTPVQRQMITHVLVQFYDMAVIAATPDAELFAEYEKVCKTGECGLPALKPKKTTKKKAKRKS